MDLKDLRIGNLIQGWHSPSSLDIVDFEILKGIGSGDQSATPIELNDKILLNTGFDIHANGYSIQVGNNLDMVISKEYELSFSLNWRDDSVCVWGVLKYVHQLQNIYYLLSGRELDIKL